MVFKNVLRYLLFATFIKLMNIVNRNKAVIPIKNKENAFMYIECLKRMNFEYYIIYLSLYN